MNIRSMRMAEMRRHFGSACFDKLQNIIYFGRKVGFADRNSSVIKCHRSAKVKNHPSLFSFRSAPVRGGFWILFFVLPKEGRALVKAGGESIWDQIIVFQSGNPPQSHAQLLHKFKLQHHWGQVTY